MASRPGLGVALGVGCLLGLFCSSAVSFVLRARSINDRPIVGILAQETDFKSFQKFGSSYIGASYVKFLESAGARVVPVRLNRSDEEYDKIFHSINGILYPGGGVSLKTSEFSRVAKIFYNKALEANDNGDYFPIWGTCLGHQLLSYLTSGEDLLTWTNTDGFAFPLNFTQGAQDSRMFKRFPDNLLQALASEPLTSNFHFWSLSVQNFTNNEKLRKFYKILTTNVHNNVDFISTMEAYRYPIYGVQWHPEKNPYEWKNSPGIPHSQPAIEVTYFTADFFVSEEFCGMYGTLCVYKPSCGLIHEFSLVCNRRRLLEKSLQPITGIFILALEALGNLQNQFDKRPRNGTNMNISLSNGNELL